MFSHHTLFWISALAFAAGLNVESSPLAAAGLAALALLTLAAGARLDAARLGRLTARELDRLEEASREKWGATR